MLSSDCLPFEVAPQNQGNKAEIPSLYLHWLLRHTSGPSIFQLLDNHCVTLLNDNDKEINNVDHFDPSLMVCLINWLLGTANIVFCPKTSIKGTAISNRLRHQEMNGTLSEISPDYSDCIITPT